jgi:hypothetical protein
MQCTSLILEDQANKGPNKCRSTKIAGYLRIHRPVSCKFETAQNAIEVIGADPSMSDDPHARWKIYCSDVTS